jgi:hypothetical protein
LQYLKQKTKDTAIDEIKKQAYAEMQIGINAAEQKAAEMLRREREKFELILKETQKQYHEAKSALKNKTEENQVDVRQTRKQK